MFSYCSTVYDVAPTEGKSQLMAFLAEFLKIRLLTLNIHGGTTETDVAATFAEAGAVEGEVWVFLDEVNTSKEIGLLTEVITNRTLHGCPIREGITVLGAVNPYRRRAAQQNDAGLGLNQHAHGDDAAQDEMRDLVYRVFPLPSSLLAYVRCSSLSFSQPSLATSVPAPVQFARLCTVLFPLYQPTLPSNQCSRSRPVCSPMYGARLSTEYLHSRGMPLSFTSLLRLKLLQVCYHWHSSRTSTASHRLAL
jgi:hypothetical protein